jgi:predicted nuclease of predicted toxin-antitoxin system
MRVLLDECVPRRLRSELTDHTVLTVTEMGWSGIKNGQLLAKAAESFDCLLTVDANLQYQQASSSLLVSVLVVRAHTNQLADLVILAPKIRDALTKLQPKELVVVGI